MTIDRETDERFGQELALLHNRIRAACGDGKKNAAALNAAGRDLVKLIERLRAKRDAA